MKNLLAALLCLLTLTTQAQTWPRNPKTGKVEFGGELPWPAGVTTDSARQMLAWKWYAHKLTTSSAEHIERQNTKAPGQSTLTYAGLPMATAISQGRYYITYLTELSADSQGMYIYLHDFKVTQLATSKTHSIERDLLVADERERVALNAVHARLVNATAKWL